VTNLKQELSSIEEKMEYQLEERTRDMQELLESCQTKVAAFIILSVIWFGFSLT